MRLKVKRSSIATIAFFAICSILTLLGLSDVAPFAMCLFFFIGITALLYAISAVHIQRKNDFIIFWLSYIAKIVYALYRFFTKYKGSLTSPFLSTDAKRFWNQAVSLYQGKATNTDTKFPYALSLEFHLFGKNLFCVLLFNIFLTMLMMVLVMILLNRLKICGNNRTLALVVVGFLPYELIVSCSVLRESIYFIFITLSFLYFYSYITEKKYKYLLFAILAVLPVILLHVGYFPIVLVYLLDSFINDRVKKPSDLLLRLCIVCSFAAVIVYSIKIDSNGAGYVSRGVSGFINKITGNSSGGYADEAGSRYLEGLTINSIPTLILYTPIRWFYFLFSPLPMNWRGLSDIAAFFLDGCIHFYVIYSTIRAKKVIKIKGSSDNCLNVKKRMLNVGLGIILFIALVFCLNTSTAGTAIRHRDVLIGIEALLLALSCDIRMSRSQV